MTALYDLQQRFAAAVLDPHQAFTQLKTNGLSATQRVQIYHNNTFISLTEALQTHFNVTAQLVGTACFTQLAHNYIRKEPTGFACLSGFGHRFAAFLRHQPSVASLPYLEDVARLEWAMQEAYHSGMGEPFPLQELARVPAVQHPTLRFVLNPSARLVCSPYPILSIWQAHQSPDIEPVRLDQGGERVLLLRDAQQIECMRLDAGAAQFIQALHTQQTLAQACEAALLQQSDFEPDRFLQTLLKNRIIVDFIASEPQENEGVA